MAQNNPTASEYRDSQEFNSTVRPLDGNMSSSQQLSNTTSQTNPTADSSYVNATKKKPTITFPKKEQAIILNVIETLKLIDYIKALARIVEPKDILFASRISNNRICVYLSSTRLVEIVATNYKIIKIGDEELHIRRLITPSKRVIISNVCPSIPHEVIENCLKSTGLKLVSPISFLRAGLSEDKFNHIMSFRRQVYILPSEDNTSLQSSLIIPYEGTNYRIFLSCDTMECYICRQTGHIASNCPNVSTQSLQPENQDEDDNIRKRALTSSPSISTANNEILDDTNANIDPIAQTEMPPPPPPKKPSHSTNSNSDAIKPALKKRKTSPSPVRDATNSTSKIIEKLYDENKTHYALTPTELKAFLETATGNSDPLMEARRYTDNVENLLDTMYDIYPHIPDRSMKIKFTRISRKIKKQLKIESSETASVTSIDSEEPSVDQMDLSHSDTLIDLSEQCSL